MSKVEDLESGSGRAGDGSSVSLCIQGLHIYPKCGTRHDKVEVGYWCNMKNLVADAVFGRSSSTQATLRMDRFGG